MQSEQLVDLVTHALEDMKGQQVRVLDVRGKTPLADYMVIASGTSNRHVKSLADSVAVKAKEAGVQPLGIEGQEGQEWVLVDLNDVIVHVMLPKVRDFYNLEKLWLAEDAGDDASGQWPGPDVIRRIRH
ncbi:ribosome silencing factor [Thioalkalivibrio paradoxus]|uniref:Ribosomal silencing factor RsfS n=1 Tax=Thioalkalivibrio paradoxus ARh 1 TaxID=713585 RepID=W0DL87_9GAMM|nr:ribosome silencing factor [Thioalkalivibrio paradoxus]AHE99196.1 ribosome-associated protein IOJAP [Thioalkalivibrio paradoxus ARh 1]